MPSWPLPCGPFRLFCLRPDEPPWRSQPASSEPEPWPERFCRAVCGQLPFNRSRVTCPDPRLAGPPPTCVRSCRRAWGIVSSHTHANNGITQPAAVHKGIGVPHAPRRKRRQPARQDHRTRHGNQPLFFAIWHVHQPHQSFGSPRTSTLQPIPHLGMRIAAAGSGCSSAAVASSSSPSPVRPPWQHDQSQPESTERAADARQLSNRSKYCSKPIACSPLHAVPPANPVRVRGLNMIRRYIGVTAMPQRACQSPRVKQSMRLIEGSSHAFETRSAISRFPGLRWCRLSSYVIFSRKSVSPTWTEI